MSTSLVHIHRPMACRNRCLSQAEGVMAPFGESQKSANLPCLGVNHLHLSTLSSSYYLK